jgi:hypothetical protein
MRTRFRLNKVELFNKFKRYLIEWAASEILGLVAKNLPWLTSGPLGWLTTKFVFWFLELFFEKTVLGINIGIIYFRNYLEAEAHIGNQEKFLQAIEQYGEAKKIPKEIQDEINQELIKTGRALIKLRVPRLPTQPS